MLSSGRTVLWLLCCVVLALRVSGMHVHLNTGHGEIPLGMHMTDVGVDHEFHHAHGHHDGEDRAHAGHMGSHSHPSLDIGLENQALGKKSADGNGLWLITTALLCWLQAVREVRRVWPRFAPRKPRRTPHLRPPLRGPPAYA